MTAYQTATLILVVAAMVLVLHSFIVTMIEEFKRGKRK